MSRTQILAHPLFSLLEFRPTGSRFVSTTLSRYGESDETRHVDVRGHEPSKLRCSTHPSWMRRVLLSMSPVSPRFRPSMPERRCQNGHPQLREAKQGEKGHAQLPRMQTEKGQVHLRLSIGCPLQYVQEARLQLHQPVGHLNYSSRKYDISQQYVHRR